MKSILESRLKEIKKQKNILFNNLKAGEEILLSGGSSDKGLYASIASPVVLSSESFSEPPKPQEQIFAIRPNGRPVKFDELVGYFSAMGLAPRG